MLWESDKSSIFAVQGVAGGASYFFSFLPFGGVPRGWLHNTLGGSEKENHVEKVGGLSVATTARGMERNVVVPNLSEHQDTISIPTHLSYYHTALRRTHQQTIE